MAAIACQHCGKAFDGRRGAKYCTAKCRKAAFDKRSAPVVELPTSQAPAGSTAGAVRAELEAVGRLETYLGQSAVALAVRIDASTAVMGFAALVKELRSTMAAAMSGVTVAMDPVDELRARRDAKLAG